MKKERRRIKRQRIFTHQKDNVDENIEGFRQEDCKEEHHGKRYGSIFFVVFCFMSLCLAGCSATAANTQAAVDAEGTGEESTAAFTAPEIGSYDSADSTVVVRKNNASKSITFQNFPTGKRYTLNFSNITDVWDKHDNAMSMEQITPGMAVDITFLKNKKSLTSIQMSKTLWTKNEVANFEIGKSGRRISMGDEVYEIDANAVLLSGSNEIEMMDINVSDRLQIAGTEHVIYGISIERGHGYLRLENDEYLIGGWIEVGKEVIKPITKDMLLVVPEGTYQVNFSHDGAKGTKEVTIARDTEVTVDVGDIKAEEAKTGQVVFSVEPDTASVYIDGELTDISGPVTLEYGVHQLIVRASGYETIAKYVRVGQEMANIHIVMESSGETEEETKSSTSKNSHNTSDEEKEEETQEETVEETEEETEEEEEQENLQGKNTSNTVDASDADYKVFIDGPVGTEVYLDGAYIGMAPTSFPKKEGSYVVTLRKTGFQTRSYTLQIDSEKKDVNFSFSELSAIS